MAPSLGPVSPPLLHLVPHFIVCISLPPQSGQLLLSRQKEKEAELCPSPCPPLTCAPCCFHSFRIPANPAPGPPASAMLSPSLWLVPCRPPSAARVAVLPQQRHPVSFLTPCSTGSLLRAHILDLLHTGSCSVWRLARLWHTALGHPHPDPLFLYSLHLFEVSTPFSTASLVSTVHL